jgi:hypothetical protein
MEYYQMFYNEECGRVNRLRELIFVLAFASLVLDCVFSCKRDKKVERLEYENKTLKGVILSSVDQALVRMMKNGCDEDDKDN